MTLTYNRIAYEIDGIKAVPDDVDGLSMLMHFDYPEAWYLKGRATFSSSSKSGSGCLYFPNENSYVSISNTTGMYNLSSLGNYEIEAFVKLNSRAAEYEAQGYKFYNGHTFKYFSKSVTWAGAKAACEALGGHLATSTSAAKNTFLTTLTTAQTWLGATDETTEGTWKWVTGETWSYTNWGSTQPDNASGVEHYLEINFGNTGEWNDNAAAAKHGYICEWNYDFGERDFTSAAGINGCILYGTHTFKYFSKSVTWADAKAACEAMGGHLATSTSAAKNTFLTTLITAQTWLGATDEAAEGTWKWVTSETWDYTNWNSGEPNNSGDEDFLELHPSGKWNDSKSANTRYYICEWDFNMIGDITDWVDRNILSFGGLALTEKIKAAHFGRLALTSTAWSINATTSSPLNAGTWYHLLLRISGETIKLFVDGTEILSEAISGNTLSSETVTLGGYIGYMDEFVFRRNDSSGAANAPVTRAVWRCETLPEGLTLSSAGVLSGHPTTAGTYECEFSVNTNWGADTKTVRIVVE